MVAGVRRGGGAEGSRHGPGVPGPVEDSVEGRGLFVGAWGLVRGLVLPLTALGMARWFEGRGQSRRFSGGYGACKW